MWNRGGPPAGPGTASWSPSVSPCFLGVKEVCVWGGSPPWEPSSALSPPGSYTARLSSIPGAACLATVSFVLGDMARRGPSQTLKQSPKDGSLGLEISEQRGNSEQWARGCSGPHCPAGSPHSANSASLEIGRGACSIFLSLISQTNVIEVRFRPSEMCAHESCSGELDECMHVWNYCHTREVDMSVTWNIPSCPGVADSPASSLRRVRICFLSLETRFASSPMLCTGNHANRAVCLCFCCPVFLI